MNTASKISKQLTRTICAVGFALASFGAELRGAVAQPSITLANHGLTKGRLAFTYIKNGRSEIHVLDFQKNKVSPLVTTGNLNEYPDWSPDGRTIVFYSDVSGDREIYRINFDGSGFTQLTTSPGVDEDPSWSPDGKKIVFNSDRLGGGGTNLFVMNADGSEQVPLSKQPSKNKNTVPKWSPRGTEIVYSTNEHWPGWDVSVLDLASGKSSLLTHGFLSYCRAGWNPDGSQFAFSYGTGKEIDLWIFERGKSEPTQLTNQPGREYDAAWTDDPSKLFYAAETEPGKDDFQIFLIDINSKTFRLVASSDGSLRYLSFTSLPHPPSMPKQEIPQALTEPTPTEGQVIPR